MGNLFSSILHIFRPVKRLHQLVNRSRLFNSYECLFEIGVTVTNYSVFAVTNQNGMILDFTFATIMTLMANYFVHISHAMRFIYSAYLIGAALILNLSFDAILFTRLSNLSMVCNLLQEYYSLYPSLDDSSVGTCLIQKNYYLYWMGLELSRILLKLLGIYFAYKAHNVMKKNFKIRKYKKQNKD